MRKRAPPLLVFDLIRKSRFARTLGERYEQKTIP